MNNLKELIISLSLPFGVSLIIPFFILILFDQSFISRFLEFNGYQIMFGAIVIVFGLYLVVWCIKLFYNSGKGTLMPVSSLETQKLVIKGPYKFIRNPMILGVIIILFGESILFGSWWLLGFCLLFFILNLFYIPLVEEKGLEERFGQQFLNYKAKVHGWIPIKKYDE